LIYLFAWLVVLLVITLGVAFTTLLERKLLRLRQNRLGPHKVGWVGILQPVLDGIKLLIKRKLLLEYTHYVLYQVIPLLRYAVMFLLFLILPLPLLTNSQAQVLWLLIVFGLNSHLLLISGWASQNKYGRLGSLRNLAQTISFEVLLTLIILLPYYLNFNLNWNSDFSFPLWALIWLWISIILIENQRAPFDLSESERELVSGFNTEFGALLFVFFFLAEYGNALITARFTSLLHWGWNWGLLIWVMLWLILRSCYPRLRFDVIISVSWIILLPVLLWVWIAFLPIPLR